MTMFRKKPVVVEASLWNKNGDHPQDECRLITPVPGDGEPFLSEGKVVRYFRSPNFHGSVACQHCQVIMHEHGWIDTLEGGHIVCPGDWIITGIKKEVYPCKPDIFKATYERAVDSGVFQAAISLPPDKLAKMTPGAIEAELQEILLVLRGDILAKREALRQGGVKVGE